MRPRRAGTPASIIPAVKASTGTEHEAQRPTGRGGDLRRRLVEAQRARTGQLVDLAVVAVLGQRQHGDLGDVVDVDERLGDLAGGHGELTRQHALDHERLAEVLREPAAAHDRPPRAGRDQLLLGALRLRLATPREEDELRDAARGREPREGADRLRRAGDREVGEVGHVDGGDVVERGRPGRVVVPVEGERARPDAHADALRPQPLDHAPPRLASAAQNQCVSAHTGIEIQIAWTVHS